MDHIVDIFGILFSYMFMDTFFHIKKQMNNIPGSGKFLCRICAGCNAEIGHGRFLSCMGGVWHPQCFQCHACHLPITDYEVRVFFSVMLA